MSVTVPTIHIYNIETITILTKSVENVRYKWIGNYNTDFENRLERHIKRELML